MVGTLTSWAGAAVMAGALVVGGTGAAHAEAPAAGHSADQAAVQERQAQKVRVTARGGADIRVRPHGHARVVGHLGLGATVVLAGPTVTVHGWLWLQLRGGGWICARDVGKLER